MKVKFDTENRTILCISDLHAPYQHPDAIQFLETISDIYEPDLVVSLGDMADFHNISFHESDPDLPGSSAELAHTVEVCRALEEIFPNMYIIGSNHGDLPIRRLKNAGLPRALLRPYNDIFGVGPGWRFVDDLTVISTSTKSRIFMVHGAVKDSLRLATRLGVNVIQGHFHTEFRIQYASNPANLLWAVNSGCLVNPKGLAFAYDKLNINRPILGTTVIVNGQPRLLPMYLNKRSRWTGDLDV